MLLVCAAAALRQILAEHLVHTRFPRRRRQLALLGDSVVVVQQHQFERWGQIQLHLRSKRAGTKGTSLQCDGIAIVQQHHQLEGWGLVQLALKVNRTGGECMLCATAMCPFTAPP